MLYVKQRELAGSGNLSVVTIPTLQVSSPRPVAYSLCCLHAGYPLSIQLSFTLLHTKLESLYLQCHSYKYLTQAHKTLKHASYWLTKLPYLSL